MLIDIEKSIVYYTFCGNQLSYDYRTADEIYNLNEDELNAILAAYEKVDIAKWENCDEEAFKWYLGLSYADGSTYTYHVNINEKKLYDFEEAILLYTSSSEKKRIHLDTK